MKKIKIFLEILPLATITLLLINIVFYISMEIIGKEGFIDVCKSRPIHDLSWKFYQLITSSFTHANLIHLILNLIVFFQASMIIEQIYGKLKTVIFYLIIGICSYFIEEGVEYIFGLTNTRGGVGASAVVFGFTSILAFILPDLKIYFMWIIGGKLKTIIKLIIVFEIFMVIFFRDNSPIGHLAHLSGAFIGLIIYYIPMNKDLSTVKNVMSYGDN